MAVSIVRAEAAAQVIGENLGQGDFDGDGQAEQLLWNDLAGQVALQNEDCILQLGSIDAAEYDLAGIADFNGDGYDDILWSCQGENILWQIKNNAVVSVQTMDVLA